MNAMKLTIRILRTIAIILVIIQILGSISTINNNKPGYPSNNNIFTLCIEYFIPIIIALFLLLAAYILNKKLQKI